MANSDLDGEWLEALEIEPSTTDDDNNGGSDDDQANGGADGDANNDEGANESAGADDDKSQGRDDSLGDDASEQDDTSVSSDDDDKKGESGDDTAAEQSEDDKYKEAVKQALQEIETSKADHTSKVNTYKEEVQKAFYPEGIDRQLRDSDGDPIRNIDDLTRLINPKTGDYFTDDEAGAYLLEAQQKLNRDVEQVEKFIEEVAETNIQIEEGADRVVKKYGDFLTKNPELKERLLAGYNKTIIKDPNTGIAISAPVDVVEYFDTVIEPIITQQTKEAEAAAKASKEAEERAKKNAATERGDFRPSGKADVIQPEDKEWAEAIKAYEEGA